MKILEINKFYNAKRGADKHFLDVIALLKKNGHEVADFAMRQVDDEKSQWSKYFLSTVGYSNSFSAWQKIRGAARMFYSLEAKKKINRILDEFEPDIVHIHNIYHQLSPAILFEIKKRGIPVVMTVHDYKLINPNHSLRLNGKAYRRCSNGRYYQCVLDRCVKNSYAKSLLAALEMYWHKWLGTYEKNIDLYIAPSKFVKKILIKWGVPKKKICVLPHFISQEKTGRQYSFNVAEKYAIYPGKISKEKGTDKLIEIFSNQKNIKLYLAGEVEHGFEIPEFKNVSYLGCIKSDQLKAYVDNCVCVVSGSELPETFGLIAMEALEASKPFVGFNAGAYPEIIQNGISGFIANDKKEFAEYVRKLASKEIVFDRQSLRQLAKRYDQKLYYEKLIMIFGKALNANWGSCKQFVEGKLSLTKSN